MVEDVENLLFDLKKQTRLHYFLEAGDNVGVFPSILQVQLPVRGPEVIVVDGGEGGVAQLGEDPLGVVSWHQQDNNNYLNAAD